MPADPIQTRPAAAPSPRFTPPSPGGANGNGEGTAGGGNRRGGGLYPTPTVGHTAPRPSENLFLWTVFLLCLVVLVMCTWIGTKYVFGHPEKPASYRLLTRLKKLQPPQRFAVRAAPVGEFITAEKLFNRVNAMSPGEFREFDTTLFRAYLRNYPANATKQAVPYLAGRFNIMDSYVLTGSDLFPSGVAALAVSTDFPKVLIEHVYSAPAATAPLIKRNLVTGTDIELRRTYDLSAVIQATKLVDGRLLLTVVPLNYGSYGFKGTSSGFSLEPPALLNPAGELPILKDGRREEANQAYVTYRQRSGIGPLFTRKKKPTVSTPSGGAASAVTGIDAPPPAPPAPGTVAPTPAPAIAVAATPAAPGVGKPGARPSGKPTPAAIAAASPTPTPPTLAAASTATSAAAAAAALAANPNEVRVERAAPVAPGANAPLVLRTAPATATNAPGVSLQPFLAGNSPAGASPGPGAAAAAPATGKDWPVFAPGKQPGGRQLKIAEIASMGDQPAAASGGPLYLNGQFFVNAVGVNPATGEKGAVLRSRDPATARMRIVVRYPSGRTLPTEGAAVDRDEQHAFQITDVRRTADGQVNVFVREVTTD